ncbi:putative carbohydrate esterase [Abeliophyllum distichum]|uniref:Carbohydrate esterase n=1 Tax=Abeliophyllum distichum TaxID=126358 RepID=A0ABD1THC4_9LAMI
MGLSNSTGKNEAQPTKQIFILSGQSNMAGRGGVDSHKHWDGVIPPECSPDPSKIFRLNAHLRWEVARDPLHQDIDAKKTCGVGPGMSFANAVKERVGVVGLGESDATSHHDADCYKENLEKLIHNVRADLHLPSLPIIQVAIASGEGRFIEKIREVQKGIELPNVVCVDANGLQLKEDNLHLTTHAQVELGHMLAEAYLTHFLPHSSHT